MSTPDLADQIASALIKAVRDEAWHRGHNAVGFGGTDYGQVVRMLLQGWQPIESAPKDGTHILAAIIDGSAGFGWVNGIHVPQMTTVHYWSKKGEEGFYLSVSEREVKKSFPATHWMVAPNPYSEDRR